MVDALIQSVRCGLQEIDCIKKEYDVEKVQHAGKIVLPDFDERLSNRLEDCQLP